MKLIPLRPNSKKPLPGMDWHKRMSDDPAEQARWIEEGLNVACPLRENGFSVVDIDDGLEYGREFYNAHKAICRILVLTRRGIHFYFSGTTRTRKFEHGDIKGNGFMVYPPSSVDGYEYRFVPNYELGNDLAPFPDELFPDDRKDADKHVTENLSVIERMVRARHYVLRAEGAVSGQNGHGRTFWLACKLRKPPPEGFGLSITEAFPLMCEWNTKCQPPWGEREILHKLESVQI